MSVAPCLEGCVAGNCQPVYPLIKHCLKLRHNISFSPLSLYVSSRLSKRQRTRHLWYPPAHISSKAIRRVVSSHPRQVVGLKTQKVVEILQYLLQKNIFQYKSEARQIFPELFAHSVTEDDKKIEVQTTMDMVPCDGPKQSLLDDIGSLYSKGKFTDLVIRCHKKEFNVHRAILSARCAWFNKALSSGFKESSGVIELPEDNPEIIDLMLQYVYCSDYTASHLESTQYGDGFDLVVHGRVYVVAEKFGLDELKAISLRKFTEASEQHWGGDNFTIAAREAYQNTMDSDEALRDVVLAALYNHSELLDKQNVQDCLREIEGLAFELVMYIRQQISFGRRKFAFGSESSVWMR